MRGTERLMGVEIDHNELRLICEAAVESPNLVPVTRELLSAICYHMIWDDLGEILDKKGTQNG